MNVINSVKDYVTNVFDFEDQDALSGAIDVVAVEHDDGSIHCSPFHVHFSKATLKRAADNVVQIIVNGAVVDGVHMKLGAAGEAYFVEAVDEPADDADYDTSPIASPALPLYASRSSSSTLRPLTTPHVDVGSPQTTMLSPTWHDAYKRVGQHDNAAAECVTWDWGALPTVQSVDWTTANNSMNNNVRSIVKNDSIYFDAIEVSSQQQQHHPAAAAAAVDQLPQLSLCGHLLDAAASQSDAQVLFMQHVVTSEAFAADGVAMLRDRRLVVQVDGRLQRMTDAFIAQCLARVLFPSASASAAPPLTLTTESVAATWTWPLDTAEHERTQPQQQTHTKSSLQPMGDNATWFLASDNDDDYSDHTDNEDVENDADRCRTDSLTRVTIDTAFSDPSPAPKRHTHTFNSSNAYYRKSLAPSQDALARMGLCNGRNDLEFVVTSTATTALCVRARLFYYPVATKLVIAELDGAATRSAAGTSPSGLFASLRTRSRRARDAAALALHTDAPAFYAQLARNGYNVLYVTTRGVEQAELIHTLLQQRSNSDSSSSSVTLPDGPVLLAPDRLLADRTLGSSPTTPPLSPTSSSSSDSSDTVDETTTSATTASFQVAALHGIRALFPPDVNPFYAAFGRLESTDSTLFTRVGVFPGKSFLVDPRTSRICHRSLRTFHETFATMLVRIDTMFPPLCAPRATTRPSYRSPAGDCTVEEALEDGDDDWIEQQRCNRMRRRRATSFEDVVVRPDAAIAAPPKSADPRQRHRRASAATRLPINATALRATLHKTSIGQVDSGDTDVVAAQAKTRSMGDEAYNDVNFWRIQPGRV